MSKEEAIQYCLDQIKPSNLSKKEYNIYNQYRSRYRKGTLTGKGLKKLFDRFGIEENCYYSIKKK